MERACLESKAPAIANIVIKYYVDFRGGDSKQSAWQEGDGGQGAQRRREQKQEQRQRDRVRPRLGLVYE